jgi:4-amino-4-deoxy-L-arabinose transferase-like glycosyltransferase
MKRIQLTSAFQPVFASSFWLFAIIALLSMAYFSGLLSVPFHPDEATHIFMSSDFEDYFNSSAGLIWQPDQPVDLHTHYRLVDPPLNRYLIGFFYWMMDLDPLKADWDWSFSWQENDFRGALPSATQLLAARLISVLFFPFSLLLMFSLGRALHSQTAGWIAMLLFAGNSLILLHTRRAMSESSLIFFILLSLWAIIRETKHPWIIAIPLALAFNAKYSAIPLLLVGVLSLFWSPSPTRLRDKLEDLGLTLLIFGLITFLLNPFLWANPLQALTAALAERQSLVANMEAGLLHIFPGQVSTGIIEQLQTNFINLFFFKPAVQDVGNYTLNLQQASQVYFSNPLHRLGVGLVYGSFAIFLSLLGFVLSLIKIFRDPFRRKPNLFIIISAFLELIGISLLLSLPFQRYILPLIPFLCLWCSISVTWLLHPLWSRINKKAA